MKAAFGTRVVSRLFEDSGKQANQSTSCYVIATVTQCSKWAEGKQ